MWLIISTEVSKLKNFSRLQAVIDTAKVVAVIQWPCLTLKVIHIFQVFSNSIFRTGVNYLTIKISTDMARRAVPLQ